MSERTYIHDLVESNTRSIAEMLKQTIEQGLVTIEDIAEALVAEASPVPAGGDIYNVTSQSLQLIQKLQNAPDRDMLVIIKKILRSTKYAATTWYSVTGLDDNPHHLPLTRAPEVASPATDTP